MHPRTPYKLPPEKEEARRKAERLEWWSIGWMTSIVVVVGLTMGSSQAMRTAWFEDMLALAPPIAFLISDRIGRMPPDDRYPYGRRRFASIAFLVSAVALFAMGVILLLDASHSLVKGERLSIGTTVLFGHQFWSGWLMVGASLYAAVPPVILGKLKKPLADELHEKTLYADAEMGRADWLTALATIAGVVGVGMGWWWADSAAAAVISLEITRDGWKNLCNAVGDLSDRRPESPEDSEPDPLPKLLAAEMRRLPWVRDARARLRTEGDVLTGEVFVVPREPEVTLQQAEEADAVIDRFSWRIYEGVMVLTKELPAAQPRNE